MVLLQMSGLSVEFPFRPYPAQLSLMSRLLAAVRGSQHALLESPTGSGKSLALLCSVLAWHRQHKQEKAAEAEAQLIDPEGEMRAAEVDEQPMVYDAFAAAAYNPYAPSAAASTAAVAASTPGTQPPSSSPSSSAAPAPAAVAPKPPKPCKIFFASRTHSQLTQLVRELKSTVYRPSMAILGSRSQYCIHPEVSQSQSKNEECKKLLDFNECRYHRQLVSTPALQPGGKHQLWDIEELVAMGTRAQACPYFAARQMAELPTTDLIFAPYNYILDPIIRKSMGIDLDGAVVIIDESHNVEDVSRSAASRELSLPDMKFAEAELTRVMATFPDDAERTRHFLTVRAIVSALITWMQEQAPTIAAAVAAAASSTKFGASQDAENLTFTGDECVSILQRVGVNGDRLKPLLSSMEHCCSKPSDTDKLEPHLSGAAAAVLESLASVFEFLFSSNMKFVKDYRMVMRRERVQRDGAGGGGSSNGAGAGARSRGGGGGGGGHGSHHGEVSYSLCFWCLNPSVAFAKLAQSARSIILTSGTLAPLDSFASELGLHFSVKLEAPHVISPSQILAHVVSRGPSGKQPFNVTFKNASDPAFHDEFGAFLMQVCQRTPAGVLLFFPSYALLDKIVDRWRSTGLWGELLRIKLVVTEPKGSGAKFDAIMERYIEANRPKASGHGQGQGKEREKEKGGRGAKRATGRKAVATATEDGDGGDSDADPSPASSRRSSSSSFSATKYTSRSLASQTGGLFLAVSRGKLSEGIDFADYAARAVIVLGIPYPNATDSKVQLKRAHNDAVKQRAAAMGIAGGGGELISGNQWYALQAYRSVNQCVGRAIRHRWDYGAIYLVDERYAEPRVQQNLSKWIQPCLGASQHGSMGCAEIMTRTEEFFEQWEKAPPGPVSANNAASQAASTAPMHSSAATTGTNPPSLQDFISSTHKPLTHFFGPSSASSSPAPSDSPPAPAPARAPATGAANGRTRTGESIELEGEGDEEVQLLPQPSYKARGGAAQQRGKLDIAYQSDTEAATPASTVASSTSILAASARSSNGSSLPKPRMSAKDLLAGFSSAASTPSATPILSAPPPPPPPPPAPTHLALRCRRCTQPLAALPLVQPVANAPPYQQTITASYFSGLVSAAAQELDGSVPYAASAQAAIPAAPVQALVCSAFALEPPCGDSYGWTGYPPILPPGLPVFPCASQFFNLWHEEDQLCYQPLCCSSCRSCVAVQILVDRREGGAGTAASFEEAVWAPNALLTVAPTSMPMEAARIKAEAANDSETGQRTAMQRQALEVLSSATPVKREAGSPARDRGAMPRTPLPAAGAATNGAGLQSLLSPPPPPLESRNDIETQRHARKELHSYASPRMLQKRRAGGGGGALGASPSAAASSPRAKPASSKRPAHADSSASPAPSSMLSDITNSPSAPPAGARAGSRSPPPKKQRSAGGPKGRAGSASAASGASAAPFRRSAPRLLDPSVLELELDGDPDDWLSTPPASAQKPRRMPPAIAPMPPPAQAAAALAGTAVAGWTHGARSKKGFV